ncbi:hypothetical protein BDZ89DRAFT_1070851 [Hymenopellis radicata]|nr:hypothetical protein BDZ89DRAFT_1070851 [Hymenopellis radicata]
MDTDQHSSTHIYTWSAECCATNPSSSSIGLPSSSTNSLFSADLPSSSNTSLLESMHAVASLGLGFAPNAEQAFNWTAPRVELVRPFGRAETALTQNMFPPTNSSQPLTAVGAGKRNLTTLTAYSPDIEGSRIAPPEFFSMHLNEEQVLIDVKKCPGLSDELSAVTDRYVQARTPPDLPVIEPDDILSHQSRAQYVARESNTMIEDEHGIGQTYDFTENMAASIASTLYTRSPVWTQHLEWTRQERHGMTHAVAGGYLYVNDGRYAPESHSKPNDALLRIHLDQPSPGSPIIVWAFVPAGDPFGIDGDEGFEDDGAILDIIQDMADGRVKFKWTACKKVTKSQGACRSSKHLNAPGRLSRTGHSMTDDATCTLAMLAAADRTQSEVITKSNHSGLRPVPLVNRARYVLQEWYSEMVAVDATYSVLSTGNKQLIAIRNRGKKTLYLSRIQDVPRACSAEDGTLPHLKVHVGMMLASLEDIDERITTAQEQMHESFDIDSTYFPAMLPKEVPRREVKEISQQLRWSVSELAIFIGRQTEVRIRWSTDLFLPLLTGMDQPQTVLRSSLYRMLDIDHEGPVDTANIVIHSALGETSFLCYVWDTAKNNPVGNTFVAKVARGRMDTQKLRAEAGMYELLRQRTRLEGIPQCFGYFEAPPREPGTDPQFGMLLLEACNKPLARQSRISPALTKAISNWLDRLHLAGIVHSGLSQENIMFDEERHKLYFRILGWGNAKAIMYNDADDLPNFEVKKQQDCKALREVFKSIGDRLEIWRHGDQAMKRMKMEQ